MKRLLLFLAVLVAAGNLHAQADDSRWVLLMQTARGNVYLDSDTVDFDTGKFRAWVRLEEPAGAYQMMRYEVSKTRYIRALEWYGYDAAGRITSQDQQPKSWSSIIPGTVAERLYRLVDAAVDLYLKEKKTTEPRTRL